MDIYTLKSINKELKKNKPVVLVTIVKTFSSTPRKAGSQMLVKTDKSIVGTIGGGLMEGEAIKDALNVFETKKSFFKNFEMTAKAAATEGMACGGQAELFLQYIEKI